MRWRAPTGLALAGLALALPGHTALAQRAAENAVNSADDAFGSSVGLEQTGIYSEQDTRGFSPARAGNARIDGVYYDPVGALSARLRQGNVVRVGFTAEQYPFQAPTGIIEYRLRPMPQELGTSIGYNQMAFGGFIREWDLRLPLVKGRLAFVGGMAQSDLRQSDGSRNAAWGYTARLIGKVGGLEIAPFAAVSYFTANHVRPITVVGDAVLPPLPEKRRYLGQAWAKGNYHNHHFGAVVRGRLVGDLSIRAGLFRALGDRLENYSEIYAILPDGDPAAPSASHRLIADPSHLIRSTSGEAQLVYSFKTGAWQHRIIAGYRARNRLTQTGGSDIRDFGTVRYGEPDPEAEPQFVFTAPNAGRVQQSAWLLGYIGRLAERLSLNLGLQKARYRATFTDGRSGRITASRDDPWLYNASLTWHAAPSLALYAGTQRGLEDSGAAPENAANRNEQLPATRTRQYEAGMRWKFGQGQLVVDAFEITKPYFTFDAARSFAEAGTVRHRGVEASLSGHFGKRFHLLAGAVLMQAGVIGAARDAGLVGERPAGTPSLFARIDANYRTDVFGGLTPTASLTYVGARAVGSRPAAALGGRQLMVPGYAAVDLGLRQSFKLGAVPVSFRLVALNVFDAASWKVLAANTVQMDERRRFNLTVAADF